MSRGSFRGNYNRSLCSPCLSSVTKRRLNLISVRFNTCTRSSKLNQRSLQHLHALVYSIQLLISRCHTVLDVQQHSCHSCLRHIESASQRHATLKEPRQVNLFWCDICGLHRLLVHVRANSCDSHFIEQLARLFYLTTDNYPLSLPIAFPLPIWKVV
jgi:hypothetical protein